MKKTVLLLLLWPLLHFVGLCQLNNTTWKLKVTPTCYDTLKLGNEQNSYYYSCELDYKIQITYSTLSDTLFLYEYDYEVTDFLNLYEFTYIPVVQDCDF